MKTLNYFIFVIAIGIFPIVASSTSYPLPLMCDDDYIESSLYLKVIKTNGLNKRDQAKKYFLKLEKLLKNKKYDMCLDKLSIKCRKQGDKKAKKTLLLYDKFYGQYYNDMEIDRSLVIGNDVLFYWKHKKQNGDFISVPFFMKNEKNVFTWGMGEHTTLHSLFSSHIRESLSFPKRYKPRIDHRKKFEVPFKESLQTENENVLLQFGGSIIKNDKDDSSLPVIRFCKKAFLELKSGNYKSFAYYHTDSSKSKILNWLSKEGTAGMLRFKEETIGSGRTLRFVINADPFFIIFHRDTLQNDEIANFKVQYIYKDQVKGFLLTNFYYSSFLDDYFQNKDLFVNKFLRPLFTKSK